MADAGRDSGAEEADERPAFAISST